MSFLFVKRDGAGRRQLHHSRPVDCIVLFLFFLSNETVLAGGNSATVIRLTLLFLLLNETALAGGTSATVIRLTLQPICRLKYCVVRFCCLMIYYCITILVVLD